MQNFLSNFELSLIQIITRSLPKIRGAGIISNFLKKIYNRKARDASYTRFEGLALFLPSQSEILFAPQLRDRLEVQFVKKTLKAGDTFVDLGANMGFYSLISAKIVGKAGKILSVEPDHDNFSFLSKNIELNNFTQIIACQCGISDCNEMITFYKDTSNNEMGSFIPQKGTIEVKLECSSLLDILNKNNIQKISFLKIDTEGFELKILSKFFKDANKALYPKFIIIESHKDSEVLKLLKQYNYNIILSNHDNHILTLL